MQDGHRQLWGLAQSLLNYFLRDSFCETRNFDRPRTAAGQHQPTTDPAVRIRKPRPPPRSRPGRTRHHQGWRSPLLSRKNCLCLQNQRRPARSLAETKSQKNSRDRLRRTGCPPRIRGLAHSSRVRHAAAGGLREAHRRRNLRTDRRSRRRNSFERRRCAQGRQKTAGGESVGRAAPDGGAGHDDGRSQVRIRADRRLRNQIAGGHPRCSRQMAGNSDRNLAGRACCPQRISRTIAGICRARL